MLNQAKCGKEVDDFLMYFKPPYAPSSVFYEVLLAGKEAHDAAYYVSAYRLQHGCRRPARC